ncbi:diacylglycerol kinase family protein [Pseudalkalibacillus decolorationis]|uniref:diacylglycerol kinase family protein n=1 Tax=Pseudalkalibacillus decolorationis TaxID=163879 RepID=UPI0021483F5B|nr:diacylglycerol kinase family protein [Pseudalkalibacillus decolorationis]
MINKVANSFRYAFQGIKEGWRNELNFRIHCICAVGTIILAYLFQFGIVKWMVLLITIGVVISLELINSAVERTVDLVTKEYHPIAKQAKDLAAASVFIFSLVAVIIGILLFAEPIFEIVIRGE